MIPKGKSFAKQILDNSQDIQSNRLKQYELLCIENPSHFVRMYKGLPHTSTPNDITIFTDQISEEFLQTLGILLPNILEINEKEITDAIPEETQIQLKQYNEKVKALRQFFATLYNIQYYNETAEPKDLKELLQKLTDVFNFTEQKTNEFITNLAEARNKKARAYFTNQLTNLERTIRDRESALLEAYTSKTNYERQLNALKTVSNDETKDFIDIINNSKYIEILKLTQTEMRLRVTAPLQYFSSPDFEVLETNPRSTLNNECTDRNIRNILHKIFVSREYKILIQAVVNIVINNSQYDEAPLNINAQCGTENMTQFPNPHLVYYDCWSKAKTEMYKNINESAYDLAILQMIAAVQTVNVNESATFINHMLYPLMKNNSDLLRLITLIDADNNELTWEDAINKEKQTQRTYTQTVIEETEETENETNTNI